MSPSERPGGARWRGLTLARGLPRWDPGVLAVATLLLAGGAVWARGTVPAERAVKTRSGAIRMTLPAGWVGSERAGGYVARRPSLGGIASTVRVSPLEATAPEVVAPPPDNELHGTAPDVAVASDPALATETALAQMEEERRTSGAAYRVLETEEKNAFGGHRSLWSHWVLVREPAGASAGAAVVPLVVRGVDVLVPRGERRFWRVSGEAPAPADGGLDPEVLRAIESLRLAR